MKIEGMLELPPMYGGQWTAQPAQGQFRQAMAQAAGGTGMDAMFEAFSAIGTVGITVGITRDLGLVSRLLIIFLMYCGRVGSLSFALSFSQRKRPAPVRQPVEKIAVG